MSDADVQLIPGAEPFSAAGGRAGALVLHGFTGNPGSMRPVAEALAAAGFTVELPRLPGHGTRIEDMCETGFEDWSSHVEAVYADLAARCDRVVVVGLSMGGTLTCWLASRHPEIAGIVCINAAVQPVDPQVGDMIQAMLDAGETISPGIGSDIADPDVVESAYDGSPLAPMKSLLAAVGELQGELANIACPVLIMTSPEDHVVDPAASDHLASVVAGPVERVTLERSYHVATLDYDRELIQERTVEFARKVTAA